jgi:hypothetical protein
MTKCRVQSPVRISDWGPDWVPVIGVMSTPIAHHISGVSCAVRLKQGKTTEEALNCERFVPIDLIMADYVAFALPFLPELDTESGTMASLRRAFPEIRFLSARRTVDGPVMMISLREASLRLVFTVEHGATYSPTRTMDPGIDVACRIEPGFDPLGHVVDFLDRFRHYLASSTTQVAQLV